MPRRKTIYLYGEERLVVERMRQTHGIVWAIPDDGMTDELRKLLEAHDWDGLVVLDNFVRENNPLVIHPIKNHHVSRKVGLQTYEKVKHDLDGDHGTSTTLGFVMIDRTFAPLRSIFDAIGHFSDNL